MLSLPELLRASHVKRWQIVQTNRVQTLAEHSFNVAMIAQALAFRCIPDFEYNTLGCFHVLNWSLLHDIIEVRTGDLATPFKDKLKQVGGDSIIHKAEFEIDSDYVQLKSTLQGSHIEVVVKCADMIEAVHFLSDNCGSRHANEVLAKLRNDLWVMVDKFASEFPDLNLQGHVGELMEEIGL